MTISAQLVKELRERTGAGMMECKNILAEAEGDIEKAIELLRKKGLAKADKKAGRIAAEGIMMSALSADGRSGVILEINCETDFVAKNEDFLGFAKQAADIVLSGAATDMAQLLDAPLNGATVEEARRTLVAKLGENINLRRFARYARSEAGAVAAYLHGGRIGVLLEVAGSHANLAELARDIAMHVAAMKPEFTRTSDVPADRVAKEKEILTAQATESGKPAEIIEKMIVGRLNKNLAELCLLNQPFVKNPDLTIEALQKNYGDAQVLQFVRFEVGEGIEKAETASFAEEVMAQVRG